MFLSSPKGWIFRGLILVMVLVIGLVISVPQEAHAITTRRYWKAYQGQLHGFLINYKAGGTYAGCSRTTQFPDGLPAGWCLSMGKISQIMAQLDRDGYWAKSNPLDRRNYLLATREQPYVMKKVVMYFEQNLNPDTWIYGASLLPEHVDPFSKQALVNLSSGFINLVGSAVNGYNIGDDDIKALAFTGDRNIGYTLKPKTEITESSLTKIYAASRMSNFQGWRYARDWTSNEANALAGAVARDRNVIDYARAHGTTPLIAKINMDSMQIAMLAIPEAGAAKTGGMALARGVSVADVSYLLSRTYQIGSRQVALDRPLLGRLFESYSGSSSAVDIDTILNGLATGSNKIGSNSVVRRLVPDVDSILQDAFVNSSHIFDDSYYRLRGFPSQIPGGWFELDSNGLPQIYYYYYGTGGVQGYVHEQIHLIRWKMSQRLGFAEGGLAVTPKDGWESMTDWTTMQILNRAGNNTVGYSGRRFIYPLASRIARRQGISLVAAQEKLLNIQFTKAYTQIDTELGRVSFWQTFNNKLANYHAKENALSGDSLYNLATHDRVIALDAYLATRSDLYAFINSP